MKWRSILPLFISLAVLALIWLLPLYTMLANSLKTPREIAQSQYMLPPGGLELQNYVQAFDILKQGLLNSLLVAVPATVLAVFLGSWAGFFLARLRFNIARPSSLSRPLLRFCPTRSSWSHLPNCWPGSI